MLFDFRHRTTGVINRLHWLHCVDMMGKTMDGRQQPTPLTAGQQKSARGRFSITFSDLFDSQQKHSIHQLLASITYTFVGTFAPCTICSRVRKFRRTKVLGSKSFTHRTLALETNGLLAKSPQFALQHKNWNWQNCLLSTNSSPTSKIVIIIVKIKVILIKNAEYKLWRRECCRHPVAQPLLCCCSLMTLTSDTVFNESVKITYITYT